MITRNDILDTITKCVGYDPVHAPKQSEIIEQAWVEHFTGVHATRQDLLDAVAEYYQTPDRAWPQPANLSSIIAENHRPIFPDRYEPLERNGDGGYVGAASPEHRAKCMAEIREILSKKRRNGW